MKERSAAQYLPVHLSLDSLRAAARGCQGCDLFKNATQTVFGEGARPAAIMLVGEQPGDREDLIGRPFVGPAGRLLDDALEAAGIDRARIYLTNVVKHFKFEPRGKRRIHQKPTPQEIRACRPWLEAELGLVAPVILVLLGATAAQALLGPDFRVTRHRREALETSWARWTFATVHPAAILRVPDPAARRAARDELVADLRLIADYLERATDGA